MCRRCTSCAAIPGGAKAPPGAPRAVIVGNGPSVDEMGAAFWRRVGRDANCMLIGTNRALCLAATRRVGYDALVIRDAYRDLWPDVRWGARYHQELWKPHPAWKVGPAAERVTHCDEFVRFDGPWRMRRETDANGEAVVMSNPSVVLMAANWAWLQGARELLLVGVDYRGDYVRMIPPYDRAGAAGAGPGGAGRYEGPVPERIERRFRHAREAVKAAGGRMINLSTRSRLACVARRRWQTVLAKP
ncbi:MAG: hypothetical protein ACYS5V_14205 [Planctomycetota bacterium]